MLINHVTYLAFGGHFGFSPSHTFSSCRDVGGFMNYDCWTFPDKVSFLYFLGSLLVIRILLAYCSSGPRYLSQ